MDRTPISGLHWSPLFVRGQVDFDALQGLAKRLLAEGVRGLVVQVVFSESSPAVIKAALSTQGVIKNELRQPLLSCTSTSMAQLKCLLAGLTGSLALLAT